MYIYIYIYVCIILCMCMCKCMSVHVCGMCARVACARVSITTSDPFPSGSVNSSVQST